ncbi:MAG: sigma-70 family RNA polymerase sigma factor [Acidobacteriia bacterium]|nr:sigma-70 family RNA polymerase sigma factor [Terriglobia bacterium]
MAGATTLGNFAGALGIPTEEAALVAELKAGSEPAYAWLIAQFQQPVYGLVYRIVSDPADAADTTQEVFLKVFRGMKHFNGSASLKTWVYRIAVHEASNRKRWWFRHKARETSIEPQATADGNSSIGLANVLVDQGDSPLENIAQQELKTRVECELRKLDEPFRTTIILREIEELSYEEIAEVMQTSLGTVKSRLTRGREALKKRLQPYLRELSPELARSNVRPQADQKVEVTS